MKIVYKTKAVATGGREGEARTEDGKHSINLSTPSEMGGSGGEGTNPEQLFACGYSACFLGAVKVAAGKENATVPDDASVAAIVGIGPRDDGQGFGIDVDLEISLPGIERTQAEELVQRAHIICPYSDATRGNVEVRLKVV